MTNLEQAEEGVVAQESVEVVQDIIDRLQSNISEGEIKSPEVRHIELLQEGKCPTCEKGVSESDAVAHEGCCDEGCYSKVDRVSIPGSYQTYTALGYFAQSKGLSISDVVMDTVSESESLKSNDSDEMVEPKEVA